MKIWNRCCCCWPLRCICNPKPSPVTGSFTAIKYDRETGLPLSGAGYTLYQNGNPLAGATSDSSGRLSFANVAPGEYTLIETTVPAGYLPEGTGHQVLVDGSGKVTIDGRSAENFPLYDVPNREAQVAFQKVDADTGEPLEGAVFALPNGVVAISGSDGMVDFGTFGVGTYTIHEITAPQGYTAVQTEYIVVVTDEGEAFIDETPIENFAAKNAKIPDPSQRPTVDTVIEYAIVVTGTGVPGSEIAMTLPDGTVVTTTVNAAGIWVATVPQGTSLLAGQIIYATQTEVGRGPSEEVSAVVQARS